MLLFSSYLHLKVQLNFNVKLDFIQMMNGLRGCGKVDVPPSRMWLVFFFLFIFKEKKLKARFLYFLYHGSDCSHLSSKTLSELVWLGGHSYVLQSTEAPVP